ncbi:vanillin synthase, chloroplastic-like [Aristolochia californica]|uniref:vanillin synthase, chloroplastic-like n=1 Tax=Aristolochia californica TaxID=171875 RepID=UPI0035E29DB6
MARFPLISFLVLCLGIVALATFDVDNPIRLVTDEARELESTILGAIGVARHAPAFVRFARRYEKRYSTVEEIKRRFGIFVENVELIQSTNRKRLSYNLKINQYGDMSWEEFHSLRLGAAQNCSATKGSHRLTEVILPNKKDWREDAIVSPVKDQGHCGSCWTFSSTGALEAAYTQATGKAISLSEQQLVDCAGAFNNFGCSGGLPSQAFEYIKYNGGLDTEQSYPYAGVNGICKFNPENVGVKIVDSVNITEGAEDELKHAVGVVRPVSVAFQVVREFRFYNGGVFTSETCGQTPMDVNHAVLAIGYGVENGIPYWLIKNSWGESWGVNGYFKMEMGKNMCGVATCASYPVVAV